MVLKFQDYIFIQKKNKYIKMANRKLISIFLFFISLIIYIILAIYEMLGFHNYNIFNMISALGIGVGIGLYYTTKKNEKNKDKREFK